MKLRWILAAMALLGSGCVCPPARADLVGWWKFNGNADDAVRGNNGVVHGSAFYTTAHFGQGLQCVSQDDGVNVADGPVFQLTQSLTIRATVYVAALPSQWGMIFFRGDDRFALDPYFLATRSDGSVVFHVESLWAADEVYAPVPLGRFTTLMGTLDNKSGRMRLYVDDVLVAQKTTAVRPFAALDPAWLPGIGIGNHGSYPASTHRFVFDGILDDVKLFDTAEQPEPRISSLKLSPNIVPGSQPVAAHLVLNRPAPAGGVVVAIAENIPAASAPATVTVPAGQNSVDFQITTTAVSAKQIGLVTATYNFSSASAKLTVRPVGVQSLALTPNTVTGPAPSIGTVTLEGNAGPGGVKVTLTSANPAVAHPNVPSILIPEGGTTGTFGITTTAVTTDTPVVFTAKANGIASTATLTVAAPYTGETFIINGQKYGTANPSETMTATFTTPDGGISVNGYKGYVLVDVSGVGQAYANVFSDAFYLYSDQFAPNPINGWDGGYYQLAFGTSTLHAFNISAAAKNAMYGALPAYNPAHTYRIILNTKLTTPGNLHFGVTDGGYSDNTGAFTLKIAQLVPLP